MTDLPAGWSSASLGEVCTIVGGGTPKTGTAEYWGGEIPWITPADMSADRSQVLSGGARTLTAAGLAASAARLVPAGSVVVSSRAPVGYVAIAGAELATNQGCKTAVSPDFIDSRYLYWYLLAARPDLEARASGTTFKEISAKEFGRTLLRWPSLDEQRRIVEILEDHLSRLDAANDYLDAASRRLDSIEQVTLERLTSVGEVRPLAELAQVQGGIQKQAKRRPVRNTYPFLRVANVTSVGLDLTDVHEIELFDGELGRYRLVEGDLLVVEGNGSPSQIGRAATWDGSIRDCVHQNHLIRVRPGAGLLPEYLESAWNAAGNRRALTAVASSTSGLYTLSVAKLQRLSLRVPPLEDQARVVAEVRAIRSARSALAHALAVGRQRSESLRRSLLAAAFSGRLTGRSSDLDVAEEMAFT